MTESQGFAPLPSRNRITFGVVTGQHQYTWPGLVEHWQLAEGAGFDSLWLFDHFLALYGDPEGPTLETSTLLAALAMVTSRARIGVLVYGNTHRNPAILAKIVTTLDVISSGRAFLGIGAAWFDVEHEALPARPPPAVHALRRKTNETESDCQRGLVRH